MQIKTVGDMLDLLDGLDRDMPFVVSLDESDENIVIDWDLMTNEDGPSDYPWGVITDEKVLNGWGWKA